MLIQNKSTDTTDLENSVSSINDVIGTTSDTNGSSTSGSIMAKLNNLITNITNHIASWTSARAAKIDTIDTNVSANKTTLATVNTNTSSVKSVVGTASDTGGTTSAGTVMAKLNDLITRVAVLESNASAGTDHVSLTGIGTTIYNVSGKSAPTASNASYHRCQGKFQATYTGWYTISVTTAQASSNLYPMCMKMYKGGLVESGSYDDYGKSCYDASTVGTEYMTSGLSYIGKCITILNFNASKSSTVTNSAQFYCQAGEYITLFQQSSNSGSAATISKIEVTVQER